MKKEIKNKVGRPRLADDRLKFESIIVCLFVIVMCIALAFVSFKILSIDFNTNKLSGSIINDHINSCILDNNKIDCGPNVTYLKYKVNDGKYIKIEKDNKPINVIINKSDKISFCFKTNNTNLICDK